MKLSVIIPVYNVEKYLKRCVNAVLAQTFNDYELLLIDDGSTDRSGQLCDEFTKKNKRIKTVHLKNTGASNARNIGIAMARGEYLTFLDSDDVIDATMFEEMEKRTQKEKYDLLISGARIVREDGSVLTEEVSLKENCYVGREQIADFLKSLHGSQRNWALNYIWNKWYRTETVLKMRQNFKTEISLGEDFLFNCEFIENANRICVLNHSYYNYIKYKKNRLTLRFQENEFERRQLICRRHKELYEAYGIFNEYKKEYQVQEGLLTYRSLMKCSYPSCPLSYSQIKIYLKQFLDSSQETFLLSYLKCAREKKAKFIGFFIKHHAVGVLAQIFFLYRTWNRLKV